MTRSDQLTIQGLSTDSEPTGSGSTRDLSNRDLPTRRQLLAQLGSAALWLALRPTGLLASSQPTAPQTIPSEDGMTITRINHFSAKPESADELYALIESFLPYIRESDGCVEARLLRQVDEPSKIVVVEVWRDQDAHRASAANVPPDTFPKAMALLAEPPGGAYYA